MSNNAVQVVNRCLDEDINVFKHTIQDVVDELEVRIPAPAIQLMHCSLACLLNADVRCSSCCRPYRMRKLL